MTREEELKEKIERLRQWLFYNSKLNDKDCPKIREYELDLLQAEAELKGITKALSLKEQEVLDNLKKDNIVTPKKDLRETTANHKCICKHHKKYHSSGACSLCGAGRCDAFKEKAKEDESQKIS